MTLGNYYTSGYTPYYAPPMPDQLAQFRQAQYQQPQQNNMPAAQQQIQNNGIIWVQGEEGAKAHMVAAGSSVLLLDSEANTFYLKSADVSGVPMPLRVFDYTERAIAYKSAHQQNGVANGDFITRAEFNALEAKINEMMLKTGEKETNSNGEPAL